jgi:hypothetical protein
MWANPGLEVHICTLTRIAARFHGSAGTNDLRLDKRRVRKISCCLHAHVGICRLPNDAGLLFKVLGRETAPVLGRRSEEIAAFRRQ